MIATPLTTTEARQSWCCCVRATPYQRGFEDYAYGRVYANPYRVGCAAWRQYEAGSEDARRSGKLVG